MARFLLVHGAWHGAWCWSRVLPILRSAGHDANAVTLTGVGERSHLLSPEIRLITHREDVLNVIRFEELDDVVLVGHSYAGMVITGVADLLLRQGSAVLRHLVYLDAVVPRPGESWSSRQPVEVVSARIEAATTINNTKVMLPPDAKVFGLQGADHEWATRRMTPHPLAVYREPLDFDAERLGALPRTFIDCSSPSLPVLAGIRKRVRQQRDWRSITLETGHDAMISAPEALGDVLLSIARQARKRGS